MKYSLEKKIRIRQNLKQTSNALLPILFSCPLSSIPFRCLKRFGGNHSARVSRMVVPCWAVHNFASEQVTQLQEEQSTDHRWIHENQFQRMKMAHCIALGTQSAVLVHPGLSHHCAGSQSLSQFQPTSYDCPSVFVTTAHNSNEVKQSCKAATIHSFSSSFLVHINSHILV